MALTFTEFKTSSRNDWISKINQDLKGSTTSDDLLYVVEEGLSISPFQTDRPTNTQDSISGGPTKSAMSFVLGSEKEANEGALSMLENGLQAMSFNVNENTNLEVLLDDIYLDMATLILRIEGSESEVKANLTAYLEKHYKNIRTDIIIHAHSKWSGFKNIILNQKADDSFILRLKNIKTVLAEYIVNNEASAVAIQMSLKNDFLAQVSELRAIRILWSTLLREGGIPYTPLTVITTIDHEESNKDIHPLIAINYLIMSSYLGMSDICFGLPFDATEMSRLCLNIQNIFQEEAYFNKVMDPTAGSYFIEALTQEMLLKA